MGIRCEDPVRMAISGLSRTRSANLPTSFGHEPTVNSAGVVFGVVSFTSRRNQEWNRQKRSLVQLVCVLPADHMIDWPTFRWRCCCCSRQPAAIDCRPDCLHIPASRLRSRDCESLIKLLFLVSPLCDTVTLHLYACDQKVTLFKIH